MIQISEHCHILNLSTKNTTTQVKSLLISLFNENKTNEIVLTENCSPFFRNLFALY